MKDVHGGRVHTANPVERAYWSMKFGVEADRLLNAVSVVGEDADRVQAYLTRSVTRSRPAARSAH